MAKRSLVKSPVALRTGGTLATTSKPWSPKVLRAGQGAHFFLELIEHADLPALARGFAGKVVAAVPHADASLFDADLRGPLMLMVGNEGAGLSPALIACATARLAIPMPGGFESLNAASAAAVCLFEKLRQDRKADPGRAAL